MSEDEKDVPKHIAQLFTKNELVSHRVTSVETKQKEIAEELDVICDKISNKIDIVKEGLNTRLDEFDTAFRGNGRIGIFEQVREVQHALDSINESINTLNEELENTHTHIQDMVDKAVVGLKDSVKKALEQGEVEYDRKTKATRWFAITAFVLMVILIGGEIFGLKLSVLKDYFNSDDKPETKQVIPHTHNDKATK